MSGLLELEGLRRTYGTLTALDDLSFQVPAGQVVGFLGPNGAGKTTLFRMIVGQEGPDDGNLRVGDTVVASYVDQNRDALVPDNTVFQEITGGVDQVVLGKRKVAAMVRVADMTRNAFMNGDISTVMSPRTVITWAQNAEIFAGDLALGFRLTFLNKCDELERPTVAEVYQRAFGGDLPESAARVKVV